jgi:hypothetical protein
MVDYLRQRQIVPFLVLVIRSTFVEEPRGCNYTNGKELL